MINQIKKERINGITLIALVITIIVLLILAGVSIATLTGDNGIIGQAGNAKLLNEVGTLKEAVRIKELEMQLNNEDKKIQLFGKIKDILGEEYLKYDERYSIEKGNIVYRDGKFSSNEIETLQENGVEKESKYYLIMNESTKESSYSGDERAITLKELQEKIDSEEFSGEEGKYNKAYIIEDLNLGATWGEDGTLTNGEQWEQISLIPENTTLDGCDFTISGMYINTTGDLKALIYENRGIIKSIVMGENSYILTTETEETSANFTAALCGTNSDTGRIIKCENKANIQGGRWGTSGICGKNGGIITECKNYGSISGYYNVSGITNGFNDQKKTPCVVTSCVNYGDIKGSEYGISRNCGRGRHRSEV